MNSANFGFVQPLIQAIVQKLPVHICQFSISIIAIKAKIRQNLVYLCKGNPFEMAKLIAPPDFSGFMWKDIQEEYVRKAASLWDNV